MPKIKKYQLLFWLLLILNIGLAGWYINKKEGWFMDELWSYGHANSSTGAFLSDDINSYFSVKETGLHHRWLEGKVFHDYLTTQENERFHYGHIWQNLKSGVHPPLFYVLLHTVCSLTPDKFSPWQVGSINLIAFLLTLIVFYKFSKLFIKDDYVAMAPVFLWGFSDIGLATCVFLRMYALQTLFAVCLLYEVTKMLLENEADNKRLFLIFVYATLGNITQFSSVILAFFTAVVAGVILLYRKNWQVLFSFAVVMLFSVAALFAIYPEAYDVLLHSKRGVETAQKAQIISHHFGELMGVLWDSNGQTRAFEVYWKELLGISGLYDLWFAVILGAVSVIGYKLKKRIYPQILALVCIFIVTSIFLSLFMPSNAGMTSRYNMLLMPLAAFLIVYLGWHVLRLLKVHIKVIYALFFLLVCGQAVHADFKQNMYLMPINEETRIYKPKLQNKNIVIVSDIPAFFENAGIFADAKAVYFAMPTLILKSVIKQADYVLISNNVAWSYIPFGKTKICFMCAPEPKPLDVDFARQLKFVAPFRNGVVNFDLYEVIH